MFLQIEERSEAAAMLNELAAKLQLAGDLGVAQKRYDKRRAPARSQPETPSARLTDGMSTEARVTTLEQAMLRAEASIEHLAEETRAFEREMRVFQGEMRVFKDEMGLFKDEMRATAERSDRRWGELANKMGTLVEDIVAPGIPEVFRKVSGHDLDPDLAIRVRRRHPVDRGRTQEFDAVASAGDLVLINETRSRLGHQDVTEFLQLLGEAGTFLPEIQGKRLVGALASFYVDPSVVKAGERQGLLMLGLSRGILEILNAPEFRPREF